MRFCKLYSGFFITLMLASGAQAVTVPDSGQDQRIEWNLQTKWPTAGKTLDMVHSLDGKYVYLLNDKQQVQVYNAQGKLQGSIPVDQGVSAIDIAPRGELLYLINNDNHTFSSIAVSFTVDIDVSGSPFKGPADAPITIAIFTDFECPYCKKIEPLLDEVLQKNPKTVKLVYKGMPLNFHKMALPAAKAAFAAREQGKFWEFHDRLFSSPELSMQVIDKIATDLHLDMARFHKDMESPQILAYIQKDVQDAQEAGVTGTPTPFINGRIPQQRDLQGFQAVINEELAKLKN